MKMLKYPKLHDVNDKAYLAKAKESIKYLTFMVTEKIDGIHLAIKITNSNIIFADKKSTITDLNKYRLIDFFTVEKIHQYKCLYDILSSLYTDDDFQGIIIYGEYYGGYYNHPEIPKYNSYTVNKNIEYSPLNGFAITDIYVESTNGYTGFLAFSYLRDLCTRLDLEVVPTYYIGTYLSCFEYSTNRNSFMPKRLNLPDPLTNNSIEGIVIRPVGETLFEGNRLLFVNKNKNYKSIFKKFPLEFNKILDLIPLYINEEKLKSVESLFLILNYPDDINMILDAFDSMFIYKVKDSIGYNLNQNALFRRYVLKQLNKSLVKYIKETNRWQQKK